MRAFASLLPFLTVSTPEPLFPMQFGRHRGRGYMIRAGPGPTQGPAPRFSGPCPIPGARAAPHLCMALRERPGA